MRLAGVLLSALSVLLITLRLFTFEFVLADDPTCGVALSAAPGLKNYRVIQSSAELAGALILIEDENTFLGARAYQLLTGPAGLVVPLLALITLLAARLRRR